MGYNWISLLGKFETKGELTVFKGGEIEYPGALPAPTKGPAIGNYICDQRFTDGKISAEVQFTQIDNNTAMEIILVYDPMPVFMLNAGIGGGGSMFSIRSFHKDKWDYLAQSGDRANLNIDHKYKIIVRRKGSRITLNVDGVDVCYANMPRPLPLGQVGVFCMSTSDIKINNYNVASEVSKVFVIMQYTKPYDELFEEVIKKVCEEFKIRAVRADETYGPGLIIADIIKEIRESQIVIAEISPANPNVYYEVGYSHALNKPTILIAEKDTKLPFDISPFRTLFYENSIGGKKKIETGLRKHIDAILTWKVEGN